MIFAAAEPPPRIPAAAHSPRLSQQICHSRQKTPRIDRRSNIPSDVTLESNFWPKTNSSSGKNSFRSQFFFERRRRRTTTTTGQNYCLDDSNNSSSSSKENCVARKGVLAKEPLSKKRPKRPKRRTCARPRGVRGGSRREREKGVVLSRDGSISLESFCAPLPKRWVSFDVFERKTQSVINPKHMEGKEIRLIFFPGFIHSQRTDA